MTFGRGSINRSDGRCFQSDSVLCRKCHYGCLGDHAGYGANRCARSRDSVGKLLV